jgi:hypothetical protein
LCKPPPRLRRHIGGFAPRRTRPTLDHGSLGNNPTTAGSAGHSGSGRCQTPQLAASRKTRNGHRSRPRAGRWRSACQRRDAGGRLGWQTWHLHSSSSASVTLWRSRCSRFANSIGSQIIRTLWRSTFKHKKTYRPRARATCCEQEATKRSARALSRHKHFGARER